METMTVFPGVYQLQFQLELDTLIPGMEPPEPGLRPFLLTGGIMDADGRIDRTLQVSGVLYPDGEAGWRAEVRKIWVFPQYRFKGLGTLALTKLPGLLDSQFPGRWTGLIVRSDAADGYFHLGGPKGGFGHMLLCNGFTWEEAGDRFVWSGSGLHIGKEK